MRLFGFGKAATATAPVAASAPSTTRKLSLEGVSEKDLVSLYASATVRTYRRGEVILRDEQTPNFLVVADGSIELTVQYGDCSGRPTIYVKGDCASPLGKAPDVKYLVEACEASTIIEITPKVLPYLPDKMQLWLHKNAYRSTDRRLQESITDCFRNQRRSALLTLYTENELAKARSIVFSEFGQGFIAKTPRLPVFAVDLTTRLLDERTTVQEVVESIKQDPSLAAALLKTVNSALYGFPQKIDSFYHATVLLGFSNIYQFVLRDSLRNVMPVTAETQRIHAHSCIISALCYEIAMACGKAHPQTAATIGLLHDIGSGAVLLMKKENPVAGEFISLLDTAKIGSDMLQRWGLPDRICRAVELQRYPEFSSPDLIESDVHQSLAVLHLAHIFETLLNGEALASTSTIYTSDYMALIGIAGITPEDYFKTRIVPALCRNKNRYAEEVQTAIARVA